MTYDDTPPRRKRLNTTPNTSVTIRVPVTVVNHFRDQIRSLPPSKRPALASLLRDCVIAHVAQEKMGNGAK
jgi:hypothetical protein